MKILPLFLTLLSSLVVITFAGNAQQIWPKAFNGSDGTLLKLYEWQPESFSNNELKARAAISILENGKADPVFGVAWLDVNTRTDGDKVQILAVRVRSIKLPGDIDDEKLESIRGTIESGTDNWNMPVPLEQLQSSLDLSTQQKALSNQINNNPPKIVYSSSPSILVLIDGAPKHQYNNQFETDVVINTPFTILKNDDDKFYLYGGKHWYTAPTATGPYEMTTSVSQKLRKIEQKVNDSEKSDNTPTESDENTIYRIIVSTEPAELIQTKGEASFSAVEGSDLLYVSNSANDIFMDVNAQDYYVLLSGRWYKSKTLSGTWQYILSDKLPDEFEKIPEGSPKDDVLASIAGTEAAKDALEEAEVPQTAKVNRQSAKAEVIYDGQPEFETIDGTGLAYATNTSASVVRWRGRYYSVDNGIWFESVAPLGPWAVSVSRPYPVALIPPRYPVYHMKYVYIYDVTPDYVYMGYTPGYLNTFIYGPTIVYGTGYHYRPWYRHHYFPRPHTWGFSVQYNPWFGWGIGFNFSKGWFNSGFYSGGYYGYGGGWWGPSNYRPYCRLPYNYYGGFYGKNSFANNRNRGYNQYYRNYNYNNNIYRNRGGVDSRSYSRNYSSGRGGNDRRQLSYNNNNPGRNNNIPANANERGNGSSIGGYNDTGPIRTRPQSIERTRQYNNRSVNDVNPSRRIEHITPNNQNRNYGIVDNSVDNNNNREGLPKRRVEVANGERTQQQTQGTRNWRYENNSRSEQRTVPGRISQPLQQREVLQPHQNRGAEIQRENVQRERVYRPQTAPAQTERREFTRPTPATRGDGNNNSKPIRQYNEGDREGGNRRAIN